MKNFFLLINIATAISLLSIGCKTSEQRTKEQTTQRKANAAADADSRKDSQNVRTPGAAGGIVIDDVP